MDDEELRKLQEALVNVLMKLRNTYGRAISKIHLTGRLPFGVKKLLTRFFLLFDESCQAYIAYHHNVSDGSDRIQCKMGCSNCCYQMPYGVSCLEYLYLYDEICRIAPDRLFLPALLDRNELLSSILQDLIKREETISDSDTLLNYSKKMVPCPFLDGSSKLCLVYSSRPLICRMHVSFTSPRFCNPLHHEPWRCGGVNIEPSEMVKEAINRFDDVFPCSFSRFLTVGIVEFMVNIMKCRPICWEL